MTKNKIRIGIAGECYVAAKLSEMGYEVAMTSKNTVGVDILVSNGSHCKNIQVKTTKGKKAKWWCKSPINISRDFVYIFVCLNDGLQPPDFFIVPDKDVQRYMERDVKKHYFFRDREWQFKNQWENLKLPPAK